MSKEVKNIIVLKNMYPNLFEEVIFVLKKGSGASEKNSPNIVNEARKIVEDYISRGNEVRAQIQGDAATENSKVTGYERGSKLNAVLNACLIVSILLLGAIIIRTF